MRKSRVLFSFVLLLGLACTGDPASPLARGRVEAVTPLPGPLEGPSPWREEFEAAAAGLVYTSEVDYPFEYFYLPAASYEPLTPSRFLALLGAHPATPVRQQSIEEFFARHTSRVDPYDAVSLALVPRYQLLEFTLEEALDDRSAFCLGRVFLRCYVAGYTAGGVVGVATWALET